MADDRYAFHDALVSALGSSNVYFDPPPTIRMNYPAIVYTRRTGDSQYADDSAYIYSQLYDVIVISKNPDEPAVKSMIKAFSKCRYDRHYISDNLHHDAFIVAI